MGMETAMGESRAFGRKVGLALLSLVLVVGLSVVHPAAAQAKGLTNASVLAMAITTVNQKGDALKTYRADQFKLVKNKNYGINKVKSFATTSRYTATANTITTKKGNKKATFSTLVHLPQSYKASGDMGNPQSVNVTPDGRYAYVTYAETGQEAAVNRWGYIVKYDLAKLAKLGATTSGSMDLLRAAAQQNYSNPSKLTDLQKEVLSCMTFGPRFQFGHGAAFALNPADGCLWFTTKTKQNKTDLRRINMTTLKPDLVINYTMSKKHAVTMGNNLTFDKKGRCYFYGYSAGGWKTAPKGSIKIYRGTIKNNKKVTFELVMQGIKYPVSSGIQSMGYNSAKDRLYMVSNGAIMSVPVSKLGKLKKSDVWSTIFNGKREYEGIAFDASGVGYLIVNKYSEIMTTPAGF